VVSTSPSEKYEFVTWDDDIPFSEWKVIKFWLVVSTNPSEKYWSVGMMKFPI